MAVDRETLRLIAGMRVAIGEDVDDAVDDLTRAWARTWNELQAEWEAAVEDLIAAGDGRWPTQAQIARATRAQKALAITRAALIDLREYADVRILQAVPDLPEQAAAWHAQITASQMPANAAADKATLVASFNRVDPAALTAIVERTTQSIRSLTLPLSVEAEAVMRAELVRGVAVGANPREAARRMVARVNGAFDGGLVRANVIARTEMLDAHRSGGRAQDVANAGVLAGWEWTAVLDRRTCASCWSKHGTRYAPEIEGPWDHQQGRCARTPVTKSWRELGFNITEPPSLTPDARTVFNGLPEADQLQIMGPRRLELLQSGKADWSDLSSRRTSAGWRDSFAPTPVKDLAA